MEKINKIFRICGVALLLMLFANIVQAQTNVNNCTVISIPGEYQLTQDIIGSSNQTCIDIESSNVTFDGKGHIIDGSGRPPNGTVGIFAGFDNVTVENSTTTNWEFGILYAGVDNGAVVNNNVSSTAEGISLYASPNNILKGNNVSNNSDTGIFIGIVVNSSLIFSNTILEENTVNNNFNYGVGLDTIRNNTLNNNNISNNGIGVNSFLSKDNTLDGNNISNNNLSINIDQSNSSTIKNNNVSNNFVGISIHSSSGNMIYNNIFNNSNNAFDDGSNIWNISETLGTNIIGGPYLGGNFWSNYLGNDTSGDRIGDTLLPYNNSGKIQNGGDFLPLTMTLGVVQTVNTGGGTVTSDTTGIGTSPSNPVVTDVTSPNTGTVTIQISPTTQTAPTGFSFLGQQVDISAPSTTASNPLTIVFTINSTEIPAGQTQDTIQIFKNGVQVPQCSGSGATPDPCISTRATLPNGDIQITVLSSNGDPWFFGLATPVPVLMNITKDFRSNVNLSANILGTLLPQNDTKYNVSYVLRPKDGTVVSTNPGSVFGVTTINGTGMTNITINDSFNAVSGPNQFNVNPPKLGGGVNIIRFNDTTNSFIDITNTSQIISTDINNSIGIVNLTINLSSPLSNDEEIIVFVKFDTALKGKLPNFEDFINTAKVITDIGAKDVSAIINFVN